MTTELNLDTLSSIEATVPAGQPFFMVNLLKFLQAAPTDGVGAGRAGQEIYFADYLPAFGEVTRRLGLDGIKPIWIGAVVGAVAGPADEQWHMVAIVEYPDFAMFRRVVESEEYRATAAPYRLAALEGLRLIATTRLEMP